MRFPVGLPRAKFQPWRYFPASGFGTELIVDPGFDTPADWTTGLGITVSGGLGHFAVASGIRSLAPNPAITTEIGSQYQVSFNIVSYTAGAISFSVGGTPGTNRSSVGTFTETVTAGATTTPNLRNSGATTADVDNFSVKKVS